MAKLLGITARRLNQLVNEGVLCKESRGAYPVRSNVKAFIEFKIRTAVDQAVPSATERMAQHKEQLLARKLAADDRTLISLEEAIGVVEEMSGIFLTFVSGLPARLVRRNLKERRRIEKILDGDRDRLSRDFAERERALRTGVSASEANREDDA